MVLQAITILIVVLGHGKIEGLSLFFEWFMPGSFHMPLFMFISGYFYKTSSEASALNFIWKKIKTLVIPYFFWNLVYGILVTLLKQNGVITFGAPLSFTTLFISPWLKGSHFGFNVGGWFVLTLFLVQVCYLLLRKMRKTLRQKNEWIFGLFLLALGILSVYFANLGYQHGPFLTAIKMLFMLPFYHLGFLYQRKIEPKEHLLCWVWFAVIFCVQFVLLKWYGPLSFGAYNATFSQKSIFLPYLSSFTGGLFWLRISKLLASGLNNNKIIRFIGQNTWTIMMHHPITFFVLNCFFWWMSQQWNLSGFQFEKFQTDIWYAYSPGQPQFVLIYVAAAMILPLSIKYGLEQWILWLDRRGQQKRMA